MTHNAHTIFVPSEYCEHPMSPPTVITTKAALAAPVTWMSLVSANVFLIAASSPPIRGKHRELLTYQGPLIAWSPLMCLQFPCLWSHSCLNLHTVSVLPSLSSLTYFMIPFCLVQNVVQRVYEKLGSVRIFILFCLPVKQRCIQVRGAFYRGSLPNCLF